MATELCHSPLSLCLSSIFNLWLTFSGRHRHIADSMLMESALNSGAEYQYIFITPHSINHVRKLPATRGKGNMISVMKMKPPQRGQQTLTQYM